MRRYRGKSDPHLERLRLGNYITCNGLNYYLIYMSFAVSMFNELVYEMHKLEQKSVHYNGH